MTSHVTTSDSDLLFEQIQLLGSIPPHDPNRHETNDGLDNHNCTNGMRVNFTVDALKVFQKTCYMDEETEVATSDLICDLLHLVHSLGCNPKNVLESALTHFLAEADS